MNEESKSKIFFGLFFILIVALMGLGTFGLRYKKKTYKEQIIDISYKMKKDKNKDFIYYEGIEPLSVELELIYQYPVINFDNEKIDEINLTLKNEEEALKSKVVKLDQVSEEEKNEALYTDDNIYSARIRDYKTFNYDKYISLLVKEYEYNCKAVGGINTYTSYVFDKTTGTYLNQSELLKEKNILFSTIQNEIRVFLNNHTDNLEEGETFDIDGTINSLNDNLAMYLDDTGKLNVLFIAKTNNNTYNESIVIE